MRSRALGAALVAAAMVAACSGDAGPGASSGRAAGDQQLVPLQSAFEVTGRAELASAVRVIPLHEVRSAEEGGALIVSGAVDGLGPGSLVVVPAVLSGRVVSATPADGGVRIEIEPASVDDLFAELDVSFGGEPDPAAVVWSPTDGTRPDGSTVIEVLDEDFLGDDTPADGTADGTAAPPADPPAMARAPGGRAPRSPAATTCPPPTTTTTPPTLPGRADIPEGVDPEDDEDAPTTTGPTLPDGTKGPPPADSTSLSVGEYTVALEHTVAAGCPTHSFKATVTRSGAIDLTGSVSGSFTASGFDGEMKKATSGTRAHTSLSLDGSITVSLVVQGRAPSEPDGLKITYDLIKKDFPVVVAGVPFIVRVGVPFILRVSVPAIGDTFIATLLELTCSGQVSTGGTGTPESVCQMKPVTPHVAEGLAIMAFIAAAGFKVGIGPGASLPTTLVDGAKTTLYGGVTATLSASTGITRSAGAGAPLVDCARIDRSVQMNVGAELDLFGALTMSTTTNIWSKDDTSNWGRQCPVSGM